MLTPIIQDAQGTCWTCRNMGRQGKDDATDKPIAWCLAQSLVVAPERGCFRHQVKPT